MSTKITHTEYLLRLKKEKIEIIPLEEYKGMLNIINHKCSCGDEFELRPSLILRGSKCMECGSKIFSHNKYLEQLKEKNIPIIPLEEWTSNIT